MVLAPFWKVKERALSCTALLLSALDTAPSESLHTLCSIIQLYSRSTVLWLCQASGRVILLVCPSSSPERNSTYPKIIWKEE